MTSATEYEELDAWEVHLVYHLVEECPSDECLTVAAPTRETAIKEARRISTSNPPELGPVYNERDRIPTASCDNWPSLKTHLELDTANDSR